MPSYSSSEGGLGAEIGCFGLWVAAIVAWITHVVFCIQHAAWILLFAGGLVFPIGVVHGVMIWFGAGWAQ